MKAFYAPHPHFRLPSNRDAKIWRYCDLGKLVTILERKALYFPSADTLADAYEGLFTLPVVTKLASRPETQRQIPFSRELKKDMFVNSWHMNEYESGAMWKVFTTAEGGIAIQSTVGRLIASFPPLPIPVESASIEKFPQVFISTVEYFDYDTDNIDTGNIFLPYLAKQKYFDYERELRAVLWRPKPMPSESNSPGEYVDTNLETLTENLYVSPSAPEYYVDAVKAVCKKYEIATLVKQSEAGTKPRYYGENA
jgi:hypothetical protein